MSTELTATCTNSTSDSGREGAPRRTAAKAVELINDTLKTEGECRLVIGQIVDEGVEANGGETTYGEDTIGSLVDDHDLQCTAEHLRKCWHYFLLMRDHGAALGGEFPELRFGHLYQISRLLQLEDEFSAVEVAATVRYMAKHSMDNGKGGKPMAADALARAVTTHINSLKGRGLETGDPDDEGDGTEDSGGEDDDLKAIDDAHAVLSDGIGAIQEAADRIARSGRYDHACDLQTNVDRIAQSHLAILGHIVRHDPKSIVIPMARKRVRDLAALVGLTVVEADASEQQEVSR